MKLLLENKGDPNVQQSDGNTPLHLACFKGDLCIVKMLLDCDANPNIQNTAVWKIGIIQGRREELRFMWRWTATTRT